MAHPGQWLEQFVEAVGRFMHCVNESRSIQCHVFHNSDDGEWEISVFGEPDRFGGRLAAWSLNAPCSIDVVGIALLFDELESCQWQTAQFDESDELGPHVAFLGTYRSKKLWLRVLSKAPNRLVSSESYGDSEDSDSDCPLS